MIAKAIKAILFADTGVTDIVGTGDNAKIYPEFAPENTQPPLVNYYVDPIIPEYDRSGNPYDLSTVELFCFDIDYDDSITLMQAVRSALELKSGTYGGVTLQDGKIQRISSDWDPVTEAHWWRITIQFKNTNN